MKRIGVSQRVAVVREYGERRDCLDQQWAKVLTSHDLLPTPLSNRVPDAKTYIDQLDLDGFVLSSGNDLTHLKCATDVAPERDRFERMLLDYSIENRLPVLGVCRGMQLVNVYFGGEVRPLDGHVARDHLVEFPEGTIDGRDRTTVNSYHDYGLRRGDLGASLRVLALAEDESVEALEHEEYPITAVMWHPERKSPSSRVDDLILQRVFEDGSP